MHLITKVGEDHFSKYAYKYLQESGIDSFTIFQTEIEPTGSSISYLADKTQNNITATYLGAITLLPCKRLISHCLILVKLTCYYCKGKLILMLM